MGAYHSNQLQSHLSVSASGGDDEKIPPAERRVLIAVDGSQGSQRAFDYWSGQPGSQNDSIVLLNTMETPNVLAGLLLSPSGTFDYDEYAKQGRLLRERSHQLERDLLAQCDKRRLRCKFVAASGASPGAAIVEAVKTHAAGVVVVGCRGNNGIRRTILGSVSHYVLTHSCRPVVVVPDA